MNSSTRSKALEILEANRRDGYTIPSSTLYPFQWNWDSAFIAAGLVHEDPEAAKSEIESLLEAQWDTGMVPQIVFWGESDRYFPGPSEWEIEVDGIETSGITQPPVVATAARDVYEHTGDKEFLERVLDPLVKCLSWWVRERSFDGSTVYIRHPWECGMDDSPAWDRPLEAIDPGSPSYTRRDLQESSADEERPTDWYYDRYVYLLRQAKRLDWNERRLREECPFLVEDILTNSIFVRACDDVAALLAAAGRNDEANAWSDQADESRTAIRERLWNDDLETFVSYDRVREEQLVENSVAGIVTTFGAIPTDRQADRLIETFRTDFAGYEYVVPTYVGEKFDPKRYWRGPVWINTNWLLARGLDAYDRRVADQIRSSTVELIEQEGFREYFDPTCGEGRGSEDFSWSAALYLDALAEEPLE